MHNYKKFYKIDETYNVIECVDCGFYHVHPYPDREYLQNFYSTVYKDELEKINLKDKVARVSRLAGKREILDIGCGNGELLTEYKNAGFAVYGIEPSESYVKECEAKGITVSKGIAEKNPFDKKFDFINLNFVLEHLPEPYAFIEKLKNEFLSANGHLYIEVPNDFNALQMTYIKYYNEYPYWIGFPDHLNYWNFDNFKTFMERAGFGITYQTASFPLEIFLLMSENYIKYKELGKIIHHKRVIFESKFKELKQTDALYELYSKLSEVNMGRTIEIIASRKK